MNAAPPSQVLVVDDDPDIRLLIPRFHQKEAHLVIPDTLYKALEALSRSVFELIICDIDVAKSPAYAPQTDLIPSFGPILTGPQYLCISDRKNVQRILLNSSQELPVLLQQLCYLQRHGFLAAVIGVNHASGQKGLKGLSFGVMTGQKPDNEGRVKSHIVDQFGDQPVYAMKAPLVLAWKDDEPADERLITLKTPEEVQKFARVWIQPILSENFDRLCGAA